MTRPVSRNAPVPTGRSGCGAWVGSRMRPVVPPTSASPADYRLRTRSREMLDRVRLPLLMLLSGTLACSGDESNRSGTGEPRGAPGVAPAHELPTSAASRPLTAADLQAAHARIAFLADSVDGRLRTVPALTGAERRRLRRDVNERQIERARRLGVRPGMPVQEAVSAGRLVPLADT